MSCLRVGDVVPATRSHLVTLGLRAALNGDPPPASRPAVTRRRFLTPLVRRAALELTLGEHGRRTLDTARMVAVLASALGPRRGGAVCGRGPADTVGR